jgi:hypothetical protein
LAPGYPLRSNPSPAHSIAVMSGVALASAVAEAHYVRYRTNGATQGPESMKPDIRNAPNPWASPIDASEPHEVRIWCRLFGCTENELRGAMAKVGTSSDKVLAELLRRDAPIRLVR